MAPMKNLQTFSVVDLWLPFFESTTFCSFSSSQSSMVSSFFFCSSSSLESWYISFFSALRSIAISCENLHLLPFSQWPFL